LFIQEENNVEIRKFETGLSFYFGYLLGVCVPREIPIDVADSAWIYGHGHDGSFWFYTFRLSSRQPIGKREHIDPRVGVPYENITVGKRRVACSI
jgi:hypothetical protein